MRHSSALTGSATAAIGLGSHDGAFGGAIDFRHTVARDFWWRAGAGIRFGESPAPELKVREYTAALGLAWSGWTSGNGRGSLALRLSALVVVGHFERRSAEADTQDRFKALPGADLAAEAGYYFTRSVGGFVGAGAEALFGETEVVVGGRSVARLAPVHPIAEASLRIGF